MPLKEMYTKFGSKPVEEIRKILSEVFQSISSRQEEQKEEQQTPFSLMMKNDTYWENAMKEAQRVDSAARPVCRPYLHGFSVGLVQSMAHPQRCDVRLVVSSVT